MAPISSVSLRSGELIPGAVSTTLFERVALPSLEEGQRTEALRFGDPRTMALVGALCITLNAVVGFTNRSLRAQVAGLLATRYTSSQMTYDLRRLRRKGLIRRQPRSNTYLLTPRWNPGGHLLHQGL